MRPLAARWYAHDGVTVLHSRAEVDAMLDSMRAAPVSHNIATMWLADDESDSRLAAPSCLMQIGITGDTGSVFYGDDRSGSDSGSWFSLGDTDAAGEVERWDGPDGQHLSPASAVVGLAQIRAGVHQFAGTGRRPTCMHGRTPRWSCSALSHTTELTRVPRSDSGCRAPAGQCLSLEHATGLPISAGIAAYLAEGRC